MTYQMTSEQQGIRDAIFRICEEFDDEFWLDRDREGGFPHELHQKLARDGWPSPKSTAAPVWASSMLPS